MIVPMKKISLITMGDKKEETLKKLRELGLVHIEISEGASIRAARINAKIFFFMVFFCLLIKMYKTVTYVEFSISCFE